jgi:Phage integrase family
MERDSPRSGASETLRTRERNAISQRKGIQSDGCSHLRSLPSIQSGIGWENVRFRRIHSTEYIRSVLFAFGRAFSECFGICHRPRRSSCGGQPQEKALRTACKRAGLQRIDWHTLRHTHGTLLHSQGTPLKVAQAPLGHSHMATTLDVYAHASVTAQRDAVNLLEGQLFPNVPKLENENRAGRNSASSVSSWSGRADLNRGPPAPKT